MTKFKQFSLGAMEPSCLYMLLLWGVWWMKVSPEEYNAINLQSIMIQT